MVEWELPEDDDSERGPVGIADPWLGLGWPSSLGWECEEEEGGGRV